jgi:hypothetical protein
MTRIAMRRRVERLEAAKSAREEVGLEEVVQWSYRPKEERTADNPEYAAFCSRLERSLLGKLLSGSQRRHGAQSNEDG